jgi:hypothetical protein
MWIAKQVDLSFMPEDMQSEICPYRDYDMNLCRASISLLKIDYFRSSCYCTSDNFSNCALFLSKTLRSK